MSDRMEIRTLGDGEFASPGRFEVRVIDPNAPTDELTNLLRALYAEKPGGTGFSSWTCTARPKTAPDSPVEAIVHDETGLTVTLKPGWQWIGSNDDGATWEAVTGKNVQARFAWLCMVEPSTGTIVPVIGNEDAILASRWTNAHREEGEDE